jgi:uncharacterized protein DUF3467
MPNRKQPTRKARKAQKADGDKVNYPVKRILPPDLVTYFVDNTIVHHTENEFAISFLQTQHPLAISKEEFEQIEQIICKCVARVILTPRHMEQLVEALQKNLEKYRESYQEKSKERSE